VRDVDSAHVPCLGTSSAERRWTGELTRLLASAPGPAALLVEAASDHPGLALTLRPRGLLDALSRTLEDGSVLVRPGPAPALLPPPPFLQGRFGHLVGSGGPREGGPVDRARIDRLGFRPFGDLGVWLGLQTLVLPARHGTVWVARRFRLASGDRSVLDRSFVALGSVVAAEWSRSIGRPASFRGAGWGARREWQRGGIRSVPPDGWFERTAGVAARSLASLESARPVREDRPVETPAIVLGASGAGKTTYLARWTARAVGRGTPAVVIDLHGDLAPAVVARLGPEGRGRVVAVDAAASPVPGVAALATDGPRDRAAAHLVAALKRLTPDGTDLYWGFRLERVFDSFVRLALESGGTLADLYDLLTNPERRESARLATRSGELARFLDDLAPVVRRNPEFLWPAATRLSKVMLVPALGELLSPGDGGLPVEALLEQGRSLLIRLPFASLGPEAATLAATLVLGRVYLGVAASAERHRVPRPVAFVLDEVHAFSPRLVAEVLTEGRKFGIRAVVATQYPDRLAPELKSAAEGALRGYVAFRVPRPSASEVGAWLGLRPEEAMAVLPSLPTGAGVTLDASDEEVRPTALEPNPPAVDDTAWPAALDATRREFHIDPEARTEPIDWDIAGDRLLLAVLASEESGSRLSREAVVAAATALPGSRAMDPARLADRLRTLVRDGSLSEDGGVVRLTPAGERRLGLTVPTGAVRETAEHRALLMAAFRLFARRGYRLEILRQGRFDTTLPDARFRQLPDREEVRAPTDLVRALERARSGWAWRFFGGRDVHVEAEVSGAIRAERVRHGVRKALLRDAFVLFVVSDAARARRVRSVIRAMGLGVDRAQVWALRLPSGSATRRATENP